MDSVHIPPVSQWPYHPNSNGISQGCQRAGPRAISGPPTIFFWPAEPFLKITKFEDKSSNFCILQSVLNTWSFFLTGVTFAQTHNSV